MVENNFVAAAGPFIHLFQIGHLDILKKLPNLFIPKSVFAEITYGPQVFHFESVKKWSNLRIVSIKPGLEIFKKGDIKRSSLHPGESDCLIWAVQHAPCIFLTDDLSARTAAEKLSIETHGTVGIIAYAAGHKWLGAKEAEKALRLICDRSSLFITPSIIDNAIRRLRVLL